jgi:hypothetical protein
MVGRRLGMKRAVLAALALWLANVVGGAVVCAAQDAVPTRVVVRVLARDAKIIGDGVGGVQVRIVDAKTGELLAEGKQSGGTGDTELIMATARTRGMKVYDTEGTAALVAELSLRKPTIVNISAVGPLGYPQAMRSATKQMLLLPGHHIEGDGVILELHGYIVEILSPQPLAPVGDRFDMSVRVRMMCGCPIAPGGMWDADEMEFIARLKVNGELVARTTLEYAGERSMFRGRMAVPADLRAGDTELEVIVSDPKSQNFGRHVIPLGEPGSGK